MKNKQKNTDGSQSDASVVYYQNDQGRKVRVGLVGLHFDVPVVAQVYPPDRPYYNEQTKEYQAYRAFSIRKLTERECLRLMDVPEEMIVKMCNAESLSRSSIYKLAGNSIVVACLRLIFQNVWWAKDDPMDAYQLFPEPTFRPVVPKCINLVTLCSGYDSQAIAMGMVCKQHGTAFELLAWSEFDPDSCRPLQQQPAVVAHDTLFPQYKDRNVGDMTKVDWQSVKDGWPDGTEVDMLTYSTPCQSISNAGKREGMKRDSGTRSSIVFYTENAIRVLRPKFLLQENVSAIVNKMNIDDFRQWQDCVSRLGYTNYYTLMNARNYGVPQNRLRMFMLSVRNDLAGTDGNPLPRFRFPRPFPLVRTIEDVVDESVGQTYFLKPEQVKRFLIKNETDNEAGSFYVITDHHFSLDELKAMWQEHER